MNAAFHSVGSVSEHSSTSPIAVFRGPNQPDTPIAAKVKQLEKALESATEEFKQIKLASSLAVEDNIIFDVIARLRLPIKVFSLDTGRLHAETLAVVEALEHKYGQTSEWVFPNAEAVEAYVNKAGLNGFYESTDLRKQCCYIRKVEPLARALADADAWITGQRQAQASTRAELPQREFDEARGIEKFNPLADWSEADVWTYVRHYNVPVNELHHKGFPSIGCEPCTRAITLGEDIRSGRWWWEDPSSKECGLHNANLKK